MGDTHEFWPRAGMPSRPLWHLWTLCPLQSGLTFNSTLQVDFQDVDARTLAERKREEEKQKRLDRIYRERAERAVQEMGGEPPGPGVPALSRLHPWANRARPTPHLPQSLAGRGPVAVLTSPAPLAGPAGQ